MKRDMILFAMCLCILAGVRLLAADRVVPAASAPAATGEWTLILDAGHGGEDGGACTAAGEKESDLNLAIVLKTRALMAFLGVEAKLTRDTDRSLHSDGAKTLRQKKNSDLKNRAAMVESVPNALVISVHQNHFTDSRYSGSQVFFNSGDFNRQWGEDTQEVLRQILNPGNDRKAKPIPEGIYLFEHISCPVILVECGFLSNGEEASLLCTDMYQRKIALALAGACVQELQKMSISSGGE